MGNSGNGIASTIFKTILALLGVYVIAINITLWATSNNVGLTQLNDYNDFKYVFGYYHSTRMKDFGYVGFESFFDLLSTFPGLKYTQGVTSTYLNIVSNYNVTGIGVLNFVAAIVRIFTAPMVLFTTVVSDIVNNALWFLGFLNIMPNTPQGNFLH